MRPVVPALMTTTALMKGDSKGIHHSLFIKAKEISDSTCRREIAHDGGEMPTMFYAFRLES
jgi:hypothetical protein